MIQSPAKAVGTLVSVTITVVTIRIEAEVSVALILRVRISRTAPTKAARIGSMAKASTMSPPGRIMISMPAKPTSTAVQRRQPTRSPSSGTASAVTNSGATKDRLMAVASGRW